MQHKEIFDRLWKDYTEQNPAVLKVHKLFLEKETEIFNDHIAFRTYNDSRLDVDVLSKLFLEAGYEEKGQYVFEEKHLTAKHYEHKTEKNAPLVFISQLILEDFSEKLQETIKNVIDNIPMERLESRELLFDGKIFGLPSYKTYKELLEESEYAAWLYINGFRANHFTVRANNNKVLDSVKKINTFLKDNGYKINSSGGEIKGNPEQLLEQSSIMAEKIKMEFQEGIYEVPGCYYEFAKRYNQPNGELFTGFIAKSADKIFESTNE
jgi:hypothetical protein